VKSDDNERHCTRRPTCFLHMIVTEWGIPSKKAVMQPCMRIFVTPSSPIQNKHHICYPHKGQWSQTTLTALWPFVKVKGHVMVEQPTSCNYTRYGCNMTEAVSHWPLTAEVGVRDWVSPCGICCHSSNGTGLFLSSSVFPCQYHYIRVPYSCISFGWLTIGLLVATLQRHNLTSPATTTKATYNIVFMKWKFRSNNSLHAP
jgi:hypothetical protein